MRPTLGEVRMAARLGRPVDHLVTSCAYAEIVRTPGRGDTDPEARRLEDIALANAAAGLPADYAVILAETRAAGDDEMVAYWGHALKAARRHLPTFGALRPLWELLDSAVADADALDDVTATSYGPAPPPPLDAAPTSPHRPCAPPALFTRGHEWLPRVDAVGAPTERERVAILTG